MPHFRAINQLSESPLKPTAAKRQLPDTTSRPKCEMNQARPSVVVPLLGKSSGEQPKHKSDLRQAVAKVRKALEKPRKKKRSSASSTRKPRRHQPVREKKLVPSIEYSPRKPTGSPTPECGDDAADDGDFVPSEADLAEISMSSAADTPSRRSPRKHPSKNRNTRLSPQASSAHAAIRRESSPPMAPGITARPPSPSILSSPQRQELYEREESVELPKSVFERIERKHRKQRKKDKRIKKEAMMAEKREEKGKAAEQRPIEETCGSRQKRDKRKAEGQMEQNEPRKRQKSEKSETPRPEDLAYDGRVLSEVPQTSKQRSAQRSSKGKTTEEQMQRYRPVPVQAENRSDITYSPSKMGIEARSESSKSKKVQPSSQAGAKAQQSPLHDAQLDQHGDQASKNRGRKKRPKQDCREFFKRREVSVPESFRPCTCEKLPDYFTRNPRYVPRLETWLGDAPQFFEHVKQISNCQGSIHPRHVVDACYWILKKSGYLEHRDENSVQSTDEVAQGFSSTSGRNDSNPGRAQSSISPPVFYGRRSGCRPDPSTGSSSRSGLRPPQDGITECTQSKTLPVRNRDQTARTDDMPLSQRHRFGVLSHPHEGNDSPSGQENVDARQVSKILPEAPSILDRPQRSFDAQRRRHQSVPVNVPSRSTTGDERNHSFTCRPQRQDNTLHEISNNAILQRCVDSLEKVLERLPATVPTQIAGPGPVSAPAASITAPAQGVNSVGQPPAGRNTRGLSHAERLRRFPKYDRNVPEHLRHTDEEIIEIGRIVNWYERHKRAPEAFGWGRGRLYCQYNELLSRTIDGVLVWTPDEIRRLTR